jgi:RNA polymerase sigma-70 factor (ECF subfamily)
MSQLMTDRLLVEAKLAAQRLTSRDGGCAAEREDLAQDAVLRAIEHPAPDGRVGPWVERICRNLHVDAWRTSRRARLLPERLAVDSPTPSAEEMALGGERRRNVRRALLTLPRDQRRALILRYYAGWSYERIAARLDVLVITARTRVHRGLAVLRCQLGALRAMMASGTLALAPAVAALIVVGAQPSVITAPVRVIPSLTSPSAIPPQHQASVRVRTTVVVAAEEETLAPPPETHRARRSSTLRFDFEDDEVTGVLARPQDEPLTSIGQAVHPSLIELRRQFVPEIVKTMEDL